MRTFRRAGAGSRAGAVAALLVFGGVGLLGLTACGPAGQSGAGTGGARSSGVAAGIPAELDAEQQVLAAVGFETQAEPSPDATPSAGRDRDGERAGPRKRHTARVLLRRNTLHGEAVVQTKDGGTKTILVQRGTITAITDTSVTVKSADGFTQTWTFGDKLHVVEHRTSIKADAIAVGDEIGVAGTRDGDRAVARLIVKRRQK
ncbi:MAG TPA: hypothetical protein VFR67_04555 [Pilimelia sp.]|nr:hypothetical protein [Pilimelia sp.]